MCAVNLQEEVKVKTYKMYPLEAGQIIFSESVVCIRTILGSCVSVTFFDPSSQTAAIIHGLYPGKGKNASYTETAIDMVVHEFQNRGITPHAVIAKLFGGSKITLSQPSDKESFMVGHENIKSARRGLERYDIAIFSEDIGSEYGRELRFFTDTGDVYIKKIGAEKGSSYSC